MTLRDVKIKKNYYSPKDNIVSDFFIPILKETVSYDRCTGFFTSQSLIELSEGIIDVIRNNGFIRIITSPKFTVEDWEAIEKGYDIKKQMSETMLRSLTLDDTDFKKSTLILSKLISLGRLDIKVAIMKDRTTESMFHAKFGIMSDNDGNSIAFSGSANDSYYGLKKNWEMISIIDTRFKGEPDYRNPMEIQTIFNDLWNNKEESAIVYELPDEVKIKIQECANNSKKEWAEFDLETMRLLEFNESVYFKRPPEIHYKDYQEKAIKKWSSQLYTGILNMATGTGKTITALGALETLYNETGGGIFTIIVCPQKHLVDQWADKVISFDVYPIVGYSDSKIGDWKSRFTNSILTASDDTNCCLVTTINSFCMDDVQLWVSRIKNLVIVVDEAHNMGSKSRLAKLPDNAKYRLGLSATIDRYKDPTGTDQLREYFGQECINLPISDAIGKVLTNYYYHPIICYFSEDEFNQFQGINTEIERIQNDPDITQKKRQSLIHEQQLKGILLLSRLRSKFSALESIVSDMRDEDHMLIYCGKTRFKDDDEDDDSDLQSIGVRVIDKVISMIGIGGTSHIDLKLSKFTYIESPEERRRILHSFQSGDIQALVAISCLDEGVDIPSIRTAIITSSSENPKEYVQRRGRVLRKYPGKEYAVIYDLVAVPRNLELRNNSHYSADLEMKLLCREISRIMIFAEDSVNPEESQKLLDCISDSYGESIEEMLNRYWR